MNADFSLHRPSRAIQALAWVMILAGCSSVEKVVDRPGRLLEPYRMDVGQGNFLSQDSVDKLKVGMSKTQVQAILGTPLLQDPFRTDRWDYVFDLKKGDGGRETRRFSVYFKEDLLERWGGDPLPTGRGDGVLPLRPAR